MAEFSDLRVQCASASQVFLWKTFEWQCDYPHQRPSTVFWNMAGIDKLPSTNRQGDISGMKYLEGHVHNLGYCISEKVMRWKHLTALAFSRKIGDSLPRENWFEDVWKSWTPDMKNLEPAAIAPGNIRRAIPYTGELPEVLK